MYPQKHDLKISQESEMFVVLLKIQLTENTITDREEDKNSLVVEPAAPETSFYATQ